MAPNFRCKFKVITKLLAEKSLCNPISISINRHACDVINFMINVILSYLLVM